MHYATPMRGRWIVAIGAIVTVGSSLLPWWSVGGGDTGLSQVSGIGISDGPVFLMFLVAVACLLLVTLPFASEKPIALDHPVAYLALLAVLVIGYVLGLIGLVNHQRFPWPPQHGFGLWIAVVGMVLFARGVFEVFEERRRRLY